MRASQRHYVYELDSELSLRAPFCGRRWRALGHSTVLGMMHASAIRKLIWIPALVGRRLRQQRARRTSDLVTGALRGRWRRPPERSSGGRCVVERAGDTRATAAPVQSAAAKAWPPTGLASARARAAKRAPTLRARKRPTGSRAKIMKLSAVALVVSRARKPEVRANIIGRQWRPHADRSRRCRRCRRCCCCWGAVSAGGH